MSTSDDRRQTATGRPETAGDERYPQGDMHPEDARYPEGTRDDVRDDPHDRDRYGATTTRTTERRTAAPGDVAADRDRVRWGPLWAGVMIALATFLLAQLAIFAAGLFQGGDAGTWLTAIAGLVAFFLGGLVVGATALWRKASDGLLNGVVMWAFATIAILVLALIGGGTLLGPVSTVAADLLQIQNLNLQNVPAEQVNEALQGAREAAGWALLGLALALVASALGGMVGAKMWPSRDTARTTAGDAEAQTVDVRR